jgi:hypothetical protein
LQLARKSNTLFIYMISGFVTNGRGFESTDGERGGGRFVVGVMVIRVRCHGDAVEVCVRM